MVGGLGGDSEALATAEIYDPVAGTWTVTGAMADARAYPTATLLANGRVLVAGGAADDIVTALATVEVYDPAAGAFSPTPPLLATRTFHTACRLASGAVLVAGGLGNDIFREVPEIFALAKPGVACAYGSECAVACVDGVCCESACAGPCEACAGVVTGAADGVCAPVVAGTDPDAECPTLPPFTCGTDGVCDGARACRKHAAGVECLAPSCTKGVVTAPTCDGAGSCAPHATVCAPYVCGDGATCATACASDAQCTPSSHCRVADGTCQPDLDAPSPCASDAACISGHCVDGICCDSACAGPCLACRSEKTGGEDGACAPVAAGTDPDDECADEGPESCGRDGLCDGVGACRFHQGTRDRRLQGQGRRRRPHGRTADRGRRVGPSDRGGRGHPGAPRRRPARPAAVGPRGVDRPRRRRDHPAGSPLRRPRRRAQGERHAARAGERGLRPARPGHGSLRLHPAARRRSGARRDRSRPRRLPARDRGRRRRRSRPHGDWHRGSRVLRSRPRHRGAPLRACPRRRHRLAPRGPDARAARPGRRAAAAHGAALRRRRRRRGAAGGRRRRGLRGRPRPRPAMGSRGHAARRPHLHGAGHVERARRRVPRARGSGVDQHGGDGDQAHHAHGDAPRERTRRCPLRERRGKRPGERGAVRSGDGLVGRSRVDRPRSIRAHRDPPPGRVHPGRGNTRRRPTGALRPADGHRNPRRRTAGVPERPPHGDRARQRQGARQRRKWRPRHPVERRDLRPRGQQLVAFGAALAFAALASALRRGRRGRVPARRTLAP